MSARIEAFLRGIRDPKAASRSADPLQQPNWFIPRLASKPFHAAEQFSWTRTLEENTAVIRGELEAMYAAGPAEEHSDRAWLVETGSWRAFTLFNRGHRVREITRRCPETTRIVEAVPGAKSAGLVYFSALEPKTRVAPHCGPINSRLRCHLGLHVPRGCELRVGGETRSWTEGRCIVFDDSYEHEAHNPTDERRVVLLLDVWHPDLTPAERRAITGFLDEQARYRRAVHAPPKDIFSSLQAFAGLPARTAK